MIIKRFNSIQRETENSFRFSIRTTYKKKLSAFNDVCKIIIGSIASVAQINNRILSIALVNHLAESTIVYIDIEQFFDKVNHDKLIQILREQVNDSTTLNLIRKYLKAGVMENGLEKATITGVPQGGPLSVVCSNVYLDKLDKELEYRGLHCFMTITLILCRSHSPNFSIYSFISPIRK